MIKKILKFLLYFTGTLTLLYIWSASCIYLFLNVSQFSAQVCYYSGLAFAVLFFINIFITKKKVTKK